MLKRISIKGYKSIREMSLELRPLNVLIGANGAGKSNLLSFFNLLKCLAGEELQLHVGRSGGADGLLCGGSRHTQEIVTSIVLQTPEGEREYKLELASVVPDSLCVAKSSVSYDDKDLNARHTSMLTSPGEGVSLESGIADRAVRGELPAVRFREFFEAFRLYHFNDTTAESRTHRQCYVHDNRRLASDAGNVAAMLHRYRETSRWHYDRIVRTVRQFAPWFSDFHVEPLELNENNVMLNWKHVGFEKEFGPHQLSDGSLRAIALTTLLLQPKEDLPGLIVIDEPELGLHPHALGIVSALIREASVFTQVLVATQSASLVDEFDVEDVVVVDHEEGGSVFKRLQADELREWIDDFALSELWEKNYLGGGAI